MIQLDSTAVLLGLSMILLAASATVSLLVHRHPPAARALFGLLAVSFVALIGVVSVDLAGAGVRTVVTEDAALVSLVAATHRRLLTILPLVLVGTSLAILSVYQERVGERHARDYRNAVAFSSGLSLIAVIVIAIETMI